MVLPHIKKLEKHKMDIKSGRRPPTSFLHLLALEPEYDVFQYKALFLLNIKLFHQSAVFPRSVVANGVRWQMLQYSYSCVVG